MRSKRILLCLLVWSLLTPVSVVASPPGKRTGRSIPSLPDLDLAYIARLPRYDYDAAKNEPKAGDAVTFEAHVANRGLQASAVFAYGWYLDDILVKNATHPALSPGEGITLSQGWTWQTGVHTIRLTLDPLNLIPEVSEQNNSIEDRTNALAVGFWVEQSVWNYFNQHQFDLGLGSVSWEDWAQRQLRVWNQMLAGAVHPPLTPQGILDRVRLDKVTLVPDGMLPACATNFPAPDDKTIDLEWGFPSEEVGISSGHVCGAFNYYIDNPDSQNVEYSLMHELSHARYLIDLYGLNEYVDAAYLSTGVTSTAATLALDRDIDADSNFSVPATLAIGGELVICQTKSGNTFSGCTRGAEGTTPRPHASGSLVNLGLVRLQDGLGNLVMGSPDMPLIGFDDHLYYSRYPDDVMNGGRVYEAYSAFAWNRIAGRRPICGNYNSPCNIGEYMRDVPGENILEILGQPLPLPQTSEFSKNSEVSPTGTMPAGLPLQGARVEVYRPRAYPSIYAKLFLKEPDAVYFTDAQGRIDLGASPFGELPETGIGPQNGVLLLKISSAGKSIYQFFEITLANEEYWLGHQDVGIYPIKTTLQQGPLPTKLFLPLVNKNHASVPVHTLAFPSRPGDGEVGNTGCASWEQCRDAPAGNQAYSTYAGATVAARLEAGKYDVKRVFLAFDTSSLPPGASILSASLNFYAGPFQNGPTLRVHVVEASHAEPLGNADFSRVGFFSGGFADLAADTWMQVTLNDSALTWIVKGGLTKLALMHDLDLLDQAPDVANDSFIAMSEDAGHQPFLEVEYIVP